MALSKAISVAIAIIWHSRPENLPLNKSLRPQQKKTSTPEPLKQQTEKPKPAPQKLSYKLEYELEHLPAKIADLEKTRDELNTKLADADFYKKDADGFQTAVKELDRINRHLDTAENRWLELMAMKDAV